MRPNAIWIAIVSAVLIALIAGCETTPTQQGAVIGGATGAGLGAIIGHQSGHQGEGALIGAAGGALTGALIGDRVDEKRKRRAAQGQQPAQRGHYETRIVTTPSGETYEERVWVPDN